MMLVSGHYDSRTEYQENFTRQHKNVSTENGIEYGDLPKS
jgi:hypothetical protein